MDEDKIIRKIRKFGKKGDRKGRGVGGEEWGRFKKLIGIIGRKEIELEVIEKGLNKKIRKLKMGIIRSWCDERKKFLIVGIGGKEIMNLIGD